jgi:hypothetical protein
MPAEPTSAPVCDIDFYSSETLADLITAYTKMLSLGPVVWLEKKDFMRSVVIQRWLRHYAIMNVLGQSALAAR